MPSLPWNMPGFQKCKTNMQNCWRGVFVNFGKNQECKSNMQNCWRCSDKRKSQQQLKNLGGQKGGFEPCHTHILRTK